MKAKYVIIARDRGSATIFANTNMLPWTEWKYTTKIFHIDPEATVIVLNGWKKKRCSLQQGALRAVLALRSKPVLYMAETERLG